MTEKTRADLVYIIAQNVKCCTISSKFHYREEFSKKIREIIMRWKHVSEIEKLFPPPYKERVSKMDEVKNSNVSFNNKTYVDTLLQKV